MAKRLLTLKYTSFYSQLPTESESYFEACTVPEKQEALKLLVTVLKDDNFNKITEALIIASKHDHPSVDSIKQVFYQFVNGRGIRQDIHNPLLSMPSCALRSAYERSQSELNPQIQEYAKRLKLSWIREHYHEVQAASNEDYLLQLFEKEIHQREERGINLLLKQATLPKVSGNPFDWTDIILTQGLDKDYLLNGTFTAQQENLIFYGGVGTGKTYLATLIGMNAIQEYGMSVKFYTMASLVNRLLDANEKAR